MIDALCTDPIGAGAALLIGLFGSAHCLVMCGGITAAFSLSIPQQARQGWSFWMLIGSASAGRIVSYTGLGLAFGLVGGWLRGDHEVLVIVFRLLTGCLLIAMGLWISELWKGLNRLESIGERLITPWVNRLRSRATPDRVANAFKYGIAWGFLPCGLVYSALLWSASTAHAGQAATQMFLFGLGTVPAIVGAGYLSASLGLTLKSQTFKRVSGGLVALYGLWTLTPVVMMMSSV
jgi:sulfite exporter TauE/SafE